MKRSANNTSVEKPIRVAVSKVKKGRRKAKVLVEGATDLEYLTKRALVRAVYIGFKVAAEKTMRMQGFNVVAEDGWVVKVYADGRRERIKRIAPVKRSKHITLS
jgi:hypothetical protein